MILDGVPTLHVVDLGETGNERRTSGSSSVDDNIPQSADISSREERSKAPKLTKEGQQILVRSQCLETFKKFLNSRKVGNESILKVWFQNFDRNQNCRIDVKEYRQGMKALNFPYDANTLWVDMDYEDTEELFFEDVDAEQARIWNTFRRWCGSTFQSPSDMIRQIKRAYVTAHGPVRGPKDVATEMEIVEGLPLCGWDLGSTSMLFSVMDLEGEGSISPKDMKWLETEIRRHHQKEEAKKRLSKIAEQRKHGRLACRMALLSFKAALRRQYGQLFRAWRRALDLDGTMTVQKAELFKVCRQLNWKGNVRSLWKALDPDGSGYCSFEELDPHSAQLLAEFRSWAVKKWGQNPAVPMFQALDVNRRRKLDYTQFVRACEAQGFNKKAHTVATCFDYQDHRLVQEEDFLILNVWRPPAWLVAKENPKAAQDFKSHLLHRYGRFVKAWRMSLDKDGANSCNWTEFNDAAKHVKYNEDVAGAWRFFDSDFSGFITLQEIDAGAYEVLMDFKRWSDEEFGCVRYAFMMMDKDKSKQVSYREFRSSCRQFGFGGDVRKLYSYLSMHAKDEVLHLEEVAFLDKWEERGGHGEMSDEDLILADGQDGEKASRLAFRINEVPGPGSYTPRSGFGKGPVNPTAKHGGSFSFGCRFHELWSPSLCSSKVGPGKYDPWTSEERYAPARRKPAWKFNQTLWDVVPTPSSRENRGWTSSKRTSKVSEFVNFSVTQHG